MTTINPWVFRVAKIANGIEVNVLVEKHRTQAGAIIAMEFYLTGWRAIKYETGDYKCYVSRLDGSSLSAFGTMKIVAYSKGYEARVSTSMEVIVDHRIK